MKVIFFISASDRLNYGDLLFPLIFKKVIDDQNESSVIFHNFGIIKSDLKHFGALPTKSFKELQLAIAQNNSNVNIIVGGGEVLFASWAKLYGFINPTVNKLLKYKVFRKLESILKISERLLTISPAPFAFSFPSSSNVNVNYNSVGGGFYKLSPKLKETALSYLNSSSHISVRDNRTLDNLSKNNISAKLIPDSAIVMSDIYFKDLNTLSTLSHFDFSKPYVFLQIGIDKAPHNLQKFLEGILNIIESLDIERIICCPIGLAPGHEDNVVLEKITSLHDSISYIHPNNVFDIMHLISKAKIYFGTSLHGVITAQSFGVKFIPLNKKIGKLDNYTKSWAGELVPGCFDFYDDQSMLDYLQHWDAELACNNLEKQKRMAYKNMQSQLANLV